MTSRSLPFPVKFDTDARNTKKQSWWISSFRRFANDYSRCFFGLLDFLKDWVWHKLINPLPAKLLINPYNAEIFLYKAWRPNSLFNSKSSWMSELALSDSFEYLCYGSMAIINIFTLTARGSTLDVRIWRLQTSDSDDWSRSPRFKG